MKLFSKIKNNPLLSFLIVLLILSFGAFVGVLLCECIETYISNLLGLSNKNETLKFLGISMGGILIALQALMSYRRAKAMEDAVEKTEQGQRQDRLKNAIEHLGHEKDSVRLGGAYELFHLAEDTEDLRQTVFDILCAHIRRTTGEDEYRERFKLKPSEEVQSLLTLLFVQKHEVFKDFHINLQGIWLNGADLREARLWKAALVGAHLQKADLYRAHLQKANLYRAHLQEANLVEAHLEQVSLYEAQLQDTVFRSARLQCANLERAYLLISNLQEAHMQGANLCSARLQGASLSNARLQGVALAFTGLIGVSLDRVCLEGVGVQAWSSSTPFADRIRMSIGKETDLSKVWFGGIEREEVDALIKNLPPEKAKILQIILTPHIGRPLSFQLPENSGAITGSYSKEDAEKWIAEYEEAMSEVPRDDS